MKSKLFIDEAFHQKEQYYYILSKLNKKMFKK